MAIQHNITANNGLSKLNITLKFKNCVRYSVTSVTILLFILSLKISSKKFNLGTIKLKFSIFLAFYRLPPSPGIIYDLPAILYGRLCPMGYGTSRDLYI